MLKKGRLIWSGTLEGLKQEYDSLEIKLQTKEPLKGILDQLDVIEEMEYADEYSARVRMKDLADSNQLVQELINEQRTLVHFELLQDSLEDAYMKVMER